MIRDLPASREFIVSQDWPKSSARTFPARSRREQPAVARGTIADDLRSHGLPRQQFRTLLEPKATRVSMDDPAIDLPDLQMSERGLRGQATRGGRSP